MNPELPDPVADVVERWLQVHDTVAPGAIEGLYLVGSAALGDWRPQSDIDVVAFTSDPTDPDLVGALRTGHEAFRAEVTSPDVDGPVLSWADVTSPPAALQRPWVLAGDFRFDAECFEINPVVWFTLSTAGVAVRGPGCGELDVWSDDTERRAWVRSNLDTYWDAVRSDVVAVLERDPERDEFSADMTEWCVLGVARMSYTLATGGVASKTAAGKWAIERFPDHRVVIERAVELRSTDDGAPVDRGVVEAVASWMDAAAS